MSVEPRVPSLAFQADAIARRQGAGACIAPHTMRNRARSGHWQRLQRGVYAAFSGEPTRETVLWAALLWVAGAGAQPPDSSRAARPGGRAESDDHHHGPRITDPGTSEDPGHPDSPVGRGVADQASGHAPAMHPSRGHGARSEPEAAPSFDVMRTRGSARPSDAGAPPQTGYARPWMRARRCAGAGELRWRSATLGTAPFPSSNTATSAGSSVRTGCPRRGGRRGSGSAPGTGTSTTSMSRMGCASNWTAPQRTPPTNSGDRQAPRQRQHAPGHPHAQVRFP